jgi:hypothetical protein
MESTLADIAEAYQGQAFSPARVCPVCAGDSRVAHRAINIHPGKPRRFDLRVCGRCRHGWIDPMPSQGLLNHLYNRGSYSVVGADWTQADEDLLTLPAKLVTARELGPGRAVGRFFEVGVGKGSLYRCFLRHGWACSGVEPGPWGRGLPRVEPDIAAVGESPAADVIAALDVLEHVADPIGMLRKIRRFAVPAARLYCAVPNRQSARAIVGRGRWRMMRPLGHVNYWSRDSLVRTVSQAGFSVEELRKTDLWEPGRIKGARGALAAVIEHLGLGDQWLVVARASAQPPAALAAVS